MLSKARPHLSWSSVVQDLLSLLESPGSRRLHSPGVARLLLEAVADPLTRAMIRVAGDTQGHQWRGIFRAAAGLLQEAPQGLESTVITGLLHAVL